MIKSGFFLLIVFVPFFVSCLYTPPPIVYPEKELAEITIAGHYTPKDPRRLERVKKEIIAGGKLKKGESFEEKYPEFSKRGDERFTVSGVSYCYNKKKAEYKKSVFHHNLILKARLYDKEGNLLEEDFLRLSYSEKYDEQGRYSEYYLKRKYEMRPKRYQIPEEHRNTPEDGLLDLRSMRAYLPYNKAGHEIRIVRLEGEKEIILSESAKVYNKTELRERSVRLNTFWRMPTGWKYNEEAECHT